MALVLFLKDRVCQGTKRALAHSQMRVGDVPGEYPSVCTGPYYRQKKRRRRKKYNAHYDKTQMQRKTWERWTQGRPWLVIDNLGVMKCTLCTEHEVTSRNFIVGCPSHKAESITFHEKSRAHKKAEILLILLFVELKNVNARE